jgi:glycosyltransferase EpsD
VGANSQKFYSITDEMKYNLRNELGYDQKRLILLCTGELNKNKNQSVVIEAISYIVREVPNILLLLAGNGPMEKKLKDLVSSLNINNNVCFLEYRTDLEKYVNICDIVVSASVREGFH